MRSELAEAVANHLGVKPNSRGNYNFRCPICGDSKRNKRKKRGWLINDGKKFSFYCHNQCGGMSLQRFAQEIMPHIDLREFSFQSMMDNYQESTTHQQDTEDFDTMMLKLEFEDVFLQEFDRVSVLDDDHDIKKYLLNRKVMENKLSDIFYIDDLQKMFDRLVQKFPYFDIYQPFFDGLKTYNPNAVAICYPFRDFNGIYDSFQLQISNHAQKYIIMNLHAETEQHAYGLYDLDPNMPVFICEGTIDSLMFNNCISSVSGNAVVNVANRLMSMGFKQEDLYLIYDRDFYNNEDVYKQFEKALMGGFNLYFYEDLGVPNKPISEIKDLNDIVTKMGVDSVTLRNSIYKFSKSEFEAVMFNQLTNNLATYK